MKAISPRFVLCGLGVVVLTGCGTERNDDGAERFTAPGPSLAGSRFSAWSAPVSLGSAINTSYNDQQPALSKDGLTLYFNSNRPENELDQVLDPNLWVAQRVCVACPWNAPVLLGPQINGPATDAAPNLSRDEHWLFFASNRIATQSNDIFVSYRENVHDDFAWQAPVNLGAPVNTVGNEGGPSYFANDEGGGPQLFFNRQTSPGNVPSGHIYVSELLADGTWSTPTAVSELNSLAADQRPSIRHDGLEIYFWSTRDAGFGNIGAGYVWHATRNTVADSWAPPQLADSPISDRSAIQPFIHSHGRTETLYYVHNNGGTGPMNLDIVMSTRVRGGRD